MVKHIVLFKLKDDVPAPEKMEAISLFKQSIENLPAIIPFIRKIEVGVNINPKEVLTNLPDAVFVVDSDGKIVWANDKASYIFEIDKRAINGCLFNDLVPDGMLSASKSSSKKAAIILFRCFFAKRVIVSYIQS